MRPMSYHLPTGRGAVSGLTPTAGIRAGQRPGKALTASVGPHLGRGPLSGVHGGVWAGLPAVFPHSHDSYGTFVCRSSRTDQYRVTTRQVGGRIGTRNS